MSTQVPGSVYPPSPHPGEPSGYDTYDPGLHQYNPGGPFGGHATLSNNLVSYWKLDETSGNRADIVGGYTAVPKTADRTQTGIRGNASEFQADNESLEIANYPALTSYTISAWVKIPVTGNQQTIASIGYDLNHACMQVVHSPGAGPGWAALIGNPSNGYHYALLLGNPDNTWQHIVATYSDSVPRHSDIYANNVQGTPSATHSELGYSAVSTLRLGSGEVQGGYGLRGRLDEVGIWSRVLTAQEIADLYNSGVGLFY